MKADFAFIADYAAERAGAVGAMGIGIDTLVVPQLPATHPHIFMVVQFRCSTEERELHQITLKLVDCYGETLLNQQGAVDFSAAPPETESVARLIFGLYMLRFSKLGQYHFVVEEKGCVLAKIPLLIIQAGGAPMAPPPIPARGPSRRRGGGPIGRG